jgi:S-formylglutathione hydrolase FrmB
MNIMIKKILLWVFAVIGVIAVISICAIWIRMSSGSNDAAPAPISGNTKIEGRSVNWFVDCGDDDSLLDRNIEFVQAMRKAQIPCQFRIGDGGHVWEYWHLSLFNCLKFVSRNFEK